MPTLKQTFPEAGISVAKSGCKVGVFLSTAKSAGFAVKK